MRFLAWAGRACGASGRGASPSPSRTPVAAWEAWRARQPACGGTDPATDTGGRTCARSLRHCVRDASRGPRIRARRSTPVPQDPSWWVPQQRYPVFMNQSSRFFSKFGPVGTRQSDHNLNYLPTHSTRLCNMSMTCHTKLRSSQPAFFRIPSAPPVGAEARLETHTMRITVPRVL